jgi:hypothetical protein
MCPLAFCVLLVFVFFLLFSENPLLLIATLQKVSVCWMIFGKYRYIIKHFASLKLTLLQSAVFLLINLCTLLQGSVAELLQCCFFPTVAIFFLFL